MANPNPQEDDEHNAVAGEFEEEPDETPKSFMARMAGRKLGQDLPKATLEDDEDEDSEPDESAVPSTAHRTLKTQKALPGEHVQSELARKYLCFDNVKDMDEYIKDDKKFRRFFDKYEAWYKGTTVQHQQSQSRWEAVEPVLKSGERDFAFENPGDEEMAAYDSDTVHAYLMSNLKKHLVDSSKGHFSSCGWSPEIRVNRMWLLIQRAKLLMKRKEKKTSAKTALQEEAEAASFNQGERLARIMALVEAREAAERESQDAPNASGEHPPKKQKLAPKVAELSKDLREFLEQAKSKGEIVGAWKPEWWEELMRDLDHDKVLKILSKPVKREGDKEGPPKFPQRKTHAWVEKQFEDEYFPSIESEEGRNDPTLPMNKFINMVTVLTGDANSDAYMTDLVKETKGTEDIGEDVLHHTTELDKAAIASKKFSSKAGEFAIRPDEATTAEQTVEKKEENQLIGEILDSKEYERSDYYGACRNLGLFPDASLHLAFTMLGVFLTWYQACEVYAISQLRKSGLVRGALLSTDVGLGKTFTCGAYMLHQWSQYLDWIWRKMTGAKSEREQTLIHNKFMRPWLIIVPSSMLIQWVRDLSKLSDRFEIVLYHGDPKAKKQASSNVDIPGIRRFQSSLHKGHHELRPKSHNKLRVILTTRETWVSKHGPSECFEWMYPNIVDTKAQLEHEDWGVLFKDWPQNLEGCFSGVIIDECHIGFKDATSHSNQSVVNLNAPHMILTSATPFVNGPDDGHGYQTLLQTNKAKRAHQDVLAKLPKEKKAYAAALATLPLPYEDGYNKADKAAREVCADSYKFFALKRKLDPRASGLINRNVLKHFLIRHTRKSEFPPGSGNTIGKDMPDCYNTTVREKFAPESKMLYSRYADDFKDRLIMNMDGDGVCINNNSYRMMSNLTTLPILGLVAIAMDDDSLKEQADTLKAKRLASIGFRRKAWRDKKLSQMYRDEKGNSTVTGGYPNWDVVAKRVAAQKQREAENPDSDWESEADSDEEYLPIEKGKGKSNIKVYRYGMPLEHRHQLEREVIGATPKDEEFARQICHDLKKYHFSEIDQVLWAKYYLEHPENIPARFEGEPELYFLWHILEIARGNDDDHKHATKKPITDFRGKDYVTRLQQPKPNDPKHLRAVKNAVAVQLIRHSPRLRLLLRWVLEASVRKEKGSVWTLWPFIQLLENSFLRLFDLESQAFMADLGHVTRDNLVQGFNQKERATTGDAIYSDFLVCSYAVGGVGLNLHLACHLAFFSCVCPNVACWKQTIGREFRFGQEEDVHATEIIIEDTFDVRVRNTALMKALPTIMAMLDNSVLAEAAGITQEELDKDTKIRLNALEGYCVATSPPLRFEHLMHFEAQKCPEGWKPLEAEDLLRLLYQRLRGDELDFSILDREDDEMDDFRARVLHREAEEAQIKADKAAAKAAKKESRKKQSKENAEARKKGIEERKEAAQKKKKDKAAERATARQRRADEREEKYQNRQIRGLDGEMKDVSEMSALGLRQLATHKGIKVTNDEGKQLRKKDIEERMIAYITQTRAADAAAKAASAQATSGGVDLDDEI